MNILNLLTKEKHVAGIEISDKIIRIAYFRPRKKRSEKIHESVVKLPEHELVLIEEPIPANIIKEGVVTDKELLGKTLKDIWGRTRLNANYAIVTIPPDKIYSHVFPFPGTVGEIHLKEAVNLAIDFQLPVKKSDVYIGWENASSSENENEILISAVPRTIADGYTEALNYSGIKILALESHLASLARSIKLKPDQMSLFVKKNPDGATIFILKNGIVQFSRTLPVAFIKKDDFLVKETDHVKTSLEIEKRIPIVMLPLEKATFTDEYLNYPELSALTPESQSQWLVAVGAAIRGEIKEGHDNHISLLPVGTTEAYEYQKTTTFIALVRNVTIGVSIFFLFTFLAAYFFIFYLSQTANATNSTISTFSPSPDILQKEAWIKDINGLTSAAQVILSTTPIWSILLDDINSRVISGIIISNFSVTSINEPISMTGIAKDRNTLNQFKKSLQTSLYLTAVELPITNIEQKGDIPFSISFRLKDPSMLYYK